MPSRLSHTPHLHLTSTSPPPHPCKASSPSPCPQARVSELSCRAYLAALVSVKSFLCLSECLSVCRKSLSLSLSLLASSFALWPIQRPFPFGFVAQNRNLQKRSQAYGSAAVFVPGTIAVIVASAYGLNKFSALYAQAFASLSVALLRSVLLVTVAV